MPSLEAFLARVSEEIATLHDRISEVEGVVERTHRKGKVTDVDASKQMYRQEIGLDDDGNPVKSPWVPYGQVAGNRKTHDPPSVGQQMLLISPDGDHEQAFGMPLTFSKDNKSPSQDGKTYVDQVGKKNTDTQQDGSRTFKIGSSSIAVTDGKIVLTADTIALVGNISLGTENASRELSLKGTIDSAGHSEQGNLSTKVKGI